jgi:hypothetical protein
MPFPLIPTMLLLGFLLVWAFIGGMILRDAQRASQDENESALGILSFTAPRADSSQPRTKDAGAGPKSGRMKKMRAAS